MVCGKRSVHMPDSTVAVFGKVATLGLQQVPPGTRPDYFLTVLHFRDCVAARRCNSTQHSTDLKEKCPFGTACKYAHGHFELWLHPGRFRTKLCSLGSNCKRTVCFFAHSEQELRVTPYSKLDTAASVAAQQLAELGQELEPNRAGASLLSGSSSSMLADIKIRPASSIASPGSSECGAGRHHSGSSSASPNNSLSVDDAAELAKLTASMAALSSPVPLLDVCGMARLQNGAYFAVDATMSGSADIPLSGTSGLWPLAGAGVMQQPAAMAYANGAYLQPQVPMLDAQLLGSGSLSGPVVAPGGDMWLMPPAAAGQWSAVSGAAAARSMLAQQQQQQCAFALGAAAAAPAATSGLAPGLPIPNLLGPSALDGWLQLDGLQAKDCYPLQAGLCAPQPLPGCGMVQPQQHAGSNGTQAQVMQQLINQQAMQQLLGLLDAQSAH
jgi:hypothetical protein